MSAWERLSARLAGPNFRGRRLLLGLDFDGTLAPIARTPGAAKISAAARRSLLRLARRRDTRLAILSGRELADVKSKIGLPGIFYSGNHGLEIAGPGLAWRHPAAHPLAGELLVELRRRVRGLPGVRVEDKRLGLAVHYRQADGRRTAAAKRDLARLLLQAGPGYRLFSSKKAFELRPALDWNKGRALETIRRVLPGTWSALIVGDDRTDEEAFKALGPRALSVRIGRVRRSKAAFVLPRRELVDRLLALLADRPAL